MNDPIVSPWTIYLIDILRPLGCVLFIISAVMMICGIASFLFSLDGDVKSEFNLGLRIFAKKLLAIGMCAALANVFLPNPHTVYKMIAASYVTPANIQATGELADKAVDKVIDKIADAIQKFERSEKK